MVKKTKTKISNRTNYTIISLLVLIALGMGVYAYGTSNPSNFGHSAGEIELNNANISAASSPNINFLRTDTDIKDGEVIGQINFKGTDSGVRVGGLIVAKAVGTWDSGLNNYSSGTKLEFWTQDSTPSNSLTSPRMVISGTGNVGIGTITPQAKLDVAGQIIVNSGDQGISYLSNTNAGVELKSSGTNKLVYIDFADGATSINSPDYRARIIRYGSAPPKNGAFSIFNNGSDSGATLTLGAGGVEDYLTIYPFGIIVIRDLSSTSPNSPTGGGGYSSGTAYVCVNNIGTLITSEEPCP